MIAFRANNIDLKSRHLYVPLSDDEMRILDEIKRQGTSKYAFARKAIVEALCRWLDEQESKK